MIYLCQRLPGVGNPLHNKCWSHNAEACFGQPFQIGIGGWPGGFCDNEMGSYNQGLADCDYIGWARLQNCSQFLLIGVSVLFKVSQHGHLQDSCIVLLVKKLFNPRTLTRGKGCIQDITVSCHPIPCLDGDANRCDAQSMAIMERTAHTLAEKVSFQAGFLAIVVYVGIMIDILLLTLPDSSFLRGTPNQRWSVQTFQEAR